MSNTTHRRPVLARIAEAAVAAPRRFIAITLLVTAVAAVLGVPVAKELCACGFEDPASQSAQATRLMTEKFDQGDQQLLIVVTAPDGHDSQAARTVGTRLVDELSRSPHVGTVTSAWTTPALGAELVSADRRSGLIVAGISGADGSAQDHAEELADRLAHDQDGVAVRAGGDAMVNAQITAQSQRDLLLMESIAIPLSFLVLVWVFGGLLAAAVPVAVGMMAVVGSLAVLRVATVFTDVSIFALNLSAAMGLALAIDYTLLMISRYRDELAGGRTRHEAVMAMMTTAGRTVIFSATIVALSMAMMAIFPMHFLKSFAYAGVATVGFAAIAALVVTPAALTLLGSRLDALNFRRQFGRNAPRSVEQSFLYRWTKLVMRRAVPVGLAVVVFMLLLGAPFLGVKWGFPDDRVLPASASAHEVGDQLRDEFARNSATAVTVVLPDAAGLSATRTTALRRRAGKGACRASSAPANGFGWQRVTDRVQRGAAVHR